MAPTQRKKPVLRRTVTFLHEFIRSRDLHPGDRLPALPRLAKEADVSYVTMVRAMRELRDAGAVSLVNRHSYVVSPPRADSGKRPVVDRPERGRLGATSGLEVRTAAPWERAAQRIRQDIVNRVFRPGALLPSLKELHARYKISFRTIKKALIQLTVEGALERTINGGFAVPSFSRDGWRPKIVCINHSPDSYTMAFGQNDETVYRALELICEQSGISIEVILLRHVFDTGRFFLRNKETGAVVTIDEVSGSDDILGFLYMVQLAPTEFDVPALESLLMRRKPVVVLDETQLLELSTPLVDSRLVRVVSAAVHSEPGLTVGRHLLSLGHRRVAFFSVDHGTVWSRLRLEGLQSSFESAGLTGAIVPFVKETHGPTIVQQAGERCRFGDLLASFHAWREAIPVEYRTDFDPAIEGLRWSTCSHAEIRSRLKPVFEEALTDVGITAWVLVNDAVASIAVDFLKEKGIRVPADLSLVSFDDTAEALRKGYSSFNFNAAAVAESVVGFLLGRKPFCDPQFTVGGFIVNRGTTGQAKRAAHRR